MVKQEKEETPTKPIMNDQQPVEHTTTQLQNLNLSRDAATAQVVDEDADAHSTHKACELLLGSVSKTQHPLQKRTRSNTHIANPPDQLPKAGPSTTRPNAELFHERRSPDPTNRGKHKRKSQKKPKGVAATLAQERQKSHALHSDNETRINELLDEQVRLSDEIAIERENYAMILSLKEEELRRTKLALLALLPTTTR